MADKQIQQIQVNEQFLEFLRQFPAELAKLIAVIKEFYKQQNNPSAPASGNVPSGPTYVFPNLPPTMTTVPISDEELDKMMENRADSAVIEKALIFLRGILTGIFVVSGGAV
jgi:hypothetical protein